MIFVGTCHYQWLGAFHPVVLKSLDNAVDQGESLLCPVRTLPYYLQRSNEYRSPEQKCLFISYRRATIKDFAKQSVSNNIKEAISLAYSEQKSDDSIKTLKGFKTHSVRHVSTSFSALKNFSMEDILKAGTWKSPKAAKGKARKIDAVF